VQLDADVLSELSIERGLTVERLRGALMDEFDGRWPSLFRGAAVLPAAASLLSALDKAGLPRAVISDYPGLAKLEGMGLDGFSVVISCRTLGALKPLPDGLHAAASQLGVPINQLLHVGDRWDTDGRAAAAAGCQFRHIDEIDPQDPLEGLMLACADKSHSRSQPDTV
jgi:HAD superfamily hydrolase (TIGR01549 family)